MFKESNLYRIQDVVLVRICLEKVSKLGTIQQRASWTFHFKFSNKLKAFYKETSDYLQYMHIIFHIPFSNVKNWFQDLLIFINTLNFADAPQTYNIGQPRASYYINLSANDINQIQPGISLIVYGTLRTYSIVKGSNGLKLSNKTQALSLQPLIVDIGSMFLHNEDFFSDVKISLSNGVVLNAHRNILVGICR